MHQTSPNSLAIVGAGPVGLEAAAHAAELGFDVHVFERGEVGDHLLAWGHVAMFTPWSWNVGPAAARALAPRGWTAPAGDTCPTGLELVERLLQPLAASPALAGRVHTHSQVVHLSRHGVRKSDRSPAAERRAHPFRLIVRDSGGRESVLHARFLIDASGTFGNPNRAGTGGIPARGESYLAPQMSYHPDDVLGARRERYAGRTTLVIGGGASAVTSVIALARLAQEVPGTRATWVTRRDSPGFPSEAWDGVLPVRDALYAEGRRLQSGGADAVRWLGGCEVEGIEYNSATHRYRVILATAAGPRAEEADQVIVNCGYGPDPALHRELRVHECFESLAPMKLAAALAGAGTGDCATTPAFGADALVNPEPDFYILGAKSYGRSSDFLLRTGYQQVADVLARLAESLPRESPARS